MPYSCPHQHVWSWRACQFKLPKHRQGSSRCLIGPIQLKCKAASEQQTVSECRPATAQLLRIAQAAVFSFAITAIACPPAHSETRVWKPRRHHRHIGERYDNRWAEPIAQHILDTEQAAAKEARAAAKAAKLAEHQRTEQQRLQREARRQEKLRLQEEARRAEEIRRTKQEIVHQITSFPSRVATFVGDYIGFASLAIFIIFLALLGKWLVRVLLAPLWTAITGAPFRFSTRGRWIYDRSLGGKRVWLPDNDEAVEPVARPASNLAPLRDEDFDNLTRIAAAVTSTSSSGVAAASKERPPPPWWQEASAIPQPAVPAKLQAAKQDEATRLLRSLEAAKVAGRDWSLEELVRLQAICEAGQVTVNPTTEERAKSMFRVAVEGVVRGLMSGPGSGMMLGDQPPGQLLHGLARALNLPEEKALATLRSTVAATFRAGILQVVATIVGKDDNECLVQLLRLASLSSNLPVLQRGDAEVDLVASSLRGRATEAQRQKIFEIYGQIDPSEGAAVVAEMLGFDPDLAIRQLAVHLQKQRGRPDAGQEPAQGA